MIDGLVPEPLLRELSEFIAGQMGLHFPSNRLHDLQRGMGHAAADFGFQDVQECIQWLLSEPLTREQVGILASRITVGETYFFREKGSLDILEKEILPGLISSRRAGDKRIRIWSAGCCTGEEPYSIAMLLDRLIQDRGSWNITILATDINPHFLKRAAAGIYGQWSFRDARPGIKEHYFKEIRKGYFEILPAIKKMVTFAFHNLAEDGCASLYNNTNAMDVILCRNVLMYFAPDLALRAVKNLHRSLLEGGWLIVSPTETSRALFAQFGTVNFPGAIFYQKDSRYSRAEGHIVSASMPAVTPHPTPDRACSPVFPAPIEPDAQLIPFPSAPAETVDSEETPEQEQDARETALALYEQGRYEEAEQNLIALVSLQQSDPRALALLARVYANQGRLAEAVTWCQRALDADKLRADCHYLLATILQELGQVEEATTALQRALYLDPDFVAAHVALGNIALRQERTREAEKHFDNVLLLLGRRAPDEVLPATEGLTAGRLREIIAATTQGLQARHARATSHRDRGRRR